MRVVRVPRLVERNREQLDAPHVVDEVRTPTVARAHLTRLILLPGAENRMPRRVHTVQVRLDDANAPAIEEHQQAPTPNGLSNEPINFFLHLTASPSVRPRLRRRYLPNIRRSYGFTNDLRSPDIAQPAGAGSTVVTPSTPPELMR
jgi:hypothetical protein